VGLGAVLLVLFVALDLRKPPRSDRASSMYVVRRAPEKAFVEEPVLVELTLVNEGEDVQRLELSDRPPERAEVMRGTPSMLCRLNRGSEATLRYELVFKEPGDYNFGTCRVRAESLFGLGEQKMVFLAPFGLRVYPKLLTAELDPIRAKAFGWIGMTPSKYRGGSLEFMNIRGYLPGDRLRDFNWKASARLGEKLVNEWQVERGLDCVVLVDLFADDVPRVVDWSARGEVVEASYELARSFVMSGNRVGMLIMGALLHKIRPGFGTKRLKAMVEALIDSEVGEVWSLEHAEEFLEEFFRPQYKGRGGTLFFVSAGRNVRLLEAAKSLSSKGFVCNTVVVDASAGESEALAKKKVLKSYELDMGLRFARAELEWFQARLSLFSNVYTWSREKGLVERRKAGS
jgi:uncharacterized protein (DUF58 family)